MDGATKWKMITGEEHGRDNTTILLTIDEHTLGIRKGQWKFIKSKDTFCNAFNYRQSIHLTKRSSQGYRLDWNGWYGPSGAYRKYYQYRTVKRSPAAQALKSMGRKLDDSTIHRHRNRATINCKPHKYPRYRRKCRVQDGCLFNIKHDPCEWHDVSKTYPSILTDMKLEIIRRKRGVIPPLNVREDPNANPKYWGYVWLNWKDYFYSRYMDQSDVDSMRFQHINMTKNVAGFFVRQYMRGRCEQDFRC